MHVLDKKFVNYFLTEQISIKNVLCFVVGQKKILITYRFTRLSDLPEKSYQTISLEDFFLSLRCLFGIFLKQNSIKVFNIYFFATS